METGIVPNDLIKAMMDAAEALPKSLPGLTICTWRELPVEHVFRAFYEDQQYLFLHPDVLAGMTTLLTREGIGNFPAGIPVESCDDGSAAAQVLQSIFHVCHRTVKEAGH